MGRLDGRVAVVTGAGRGIGAAVARLFAAEGASVVVNDLGVAVDGTDPRPGPAEQVVADIVAAGGNAVLNANDVADHAAAEAIIGQAIDVFGKLDVVVNVAGILRDRMLFNMSEEEWDAVIRVHLKGTFNTSKHASVYWRKLRDPQAHHRLINFTSRAGLHGGPGQPNYAAAKMGIIGFTYSCANALGQYGVTANAIGPGAVTRMFDAVPGERTGNPRPPGEDSADNVAPAVAYLASERSDWCTGQVISARGYDIALYSKPHLIRQVSSPGPWDLSHAFDLMERSFRPAVTGEQLA
jgi:NAD(P)-dependent dehydrogenase (short-subunit alcohol dehydrogenase family)